MNRYYVSFMKKGELYETAVRATTADEARNFIATKYNVPTKFEVGTQDMNKDNHVDNHVSAVIQINKKDV